MSGLAFLQRPQCAVSQITLLNRSSLAKMASSATTRSSRSSFAAATSRAAVGEAFTSIPCCASPPRGAKKKLRFSAKCLPTRRLPARRLPREGSATIPDLIATPRLELATALIAASIGAVLWSEG